MRSDGGHSQVLFTYKHMGLTLNMGLLSGASGSLTIDPKSPGSAKLSVDMPINTLHSTIPKPWTRSSSRRCSSTPQSSRPPTSRSTSVTVSGKTAKIAGNLTIRGVTKPATIDATLLATGNGPMSKKPVIAFQGVAHIKRSDYGKELGMAVPMVADDVKLDITAQFDQK